MITPSEHAQPSSATPNLTDTSESVVANPFGWRLRLVVFVAGAVLMALEMAGSRVLAIHFGSSIYVWGAIIGVFLAALAGGYYTGGIIADRRPTFLLLTLLLFAAGCWLVLIPIYANRVNSVIRSIHFGERLDPLIATVLLFGGPSVLLGTVSPFAVRLAARSVERIGNLSGRLYALSTVGSIAGTMVSAFWLIPLIGVRALLQSLGAMLILVVLVVLPKSRATVTTALAGLAALSASLWVTSVFGRPKHTVVFEADSAYHHLQVIDNSYLNSRALQFNNYTESMIDLAPPHLTRLRSTDAFQLARIFRPRLERVLIIGGGGGVGARAFVEQDPNVIVDLVEIDPVVVDVGERYFYLQRGPRLNVHVEDGRQFVRRTQSKFDLVVLDAYTIGGQIPFHLTTREFTQELKRILNPGGIMLANITSRLEGPRSKVLRSECKTFASTFSSLYVFPIPLNLETVLDRKAPRNVIVVAFDGDENWPSEEIVNAAQLLVQNRVVTVPGLVDYTRFVITTPLQFNDVPVLTDDYAPIDTMLF